QGPEEREHPGGIDPPDQARLRLARADRGLLPGRAPGPDGLLLHAAPTARRRAHDPEAAAAAQGEHGPADAGERRQARDGEGMAFGHRPGRPGSPPLGPLGFAGFGSNGRQAESPSPDGVITANRRPREDWKPTTPGTLANRVSSLPLPTPRPGWIRVPRWRTMMVPAGTLCPPNAFTPSRLDWESRPLRDAPPPFLCAIGCPGYQPLFLGGSPCWLPLALGLGGRGPGRLALRGGLRRAGRAPAPPR